MEPQKWSYLTHRSNITAFNDAITQAAFDDIKERTNGLLDIQTVVLGELPIQSQDFLRAARDGDIDMFLLTDHQAPDFPPVRIMYIPWLAENQLEKALIFEACHPILERELNNSNLHLLAYQPFGQVGMWTTQPIDMMDVKGIPVRSVSAGYAAMTEAIGGVPVHVEWAETYTALQRGLVKAVICGFDSCTSAKFVEVAPYGYNIHMSHPIYSINVNMDRWQSLPPEFQLIVMEELQDAMMAIQAQVPQALEAEVAMQRSQGLKEYQHEAPDGWFELMSEGVVKPLLAKELQSMGALGDEIATAIEAALGRSIR